MRKVVDAAARRTPIGKFLGGLSKLSPADLGAALEFFRGLNNLFAYIVAGTACAALLLGLDTVAARLALETYGAEKVKRD